jgi:hypothetical protein
LERFEERESRIRSVNHRRRDCVVQRDHRTLGDADAIRCS